MELIANDCYYINARKHLKKMQVPEVTICMYVCHTNAHVNTIRWVQMLTF